MGQSARKKRRQYFLPTGSQPRLLLGIELIFLVLLIVSGATFYVVADRDLTESYYQAHLQIKNLKEILLPVLLVVNLGGLVIGAVMSIFFTHRIAGPVHRLARILRQIGEGNLNHVIRFRRHDELKELEQAAEEMLVALNARMAEVRRAARRLHERVDALSEAPSVSSDEVDALRHEAEQLLRLIEEFHLQESNGRAS